MSGVPIEEDHRLLVLLADGATNDELAMALGIPLQTLKSRIRRLMTQYKVRNRTALASLAQNNGTLRALRSDVTHTELVLRLRDWIGVPVAIDAISDALQIVFQVRTSRPAALRDLLRTMIEDEPNRALLLILTLASLVPLDESPNVLLRWLQMPLRQTTNVRPDQRASAAANG